ncbi:Putative Isoflavone reductase family protein (AFU_orthologue; AFUA_1G12510) [Aspergillus calidoustus]|uniref:Putative Isoflavone reductase family protein (AFU_orthologue AFUA_1G12510) n=1 Tax=Aspergillus calidoustus TaxID=454130 RepID=A0A0U5GCQ3_ASPCI|nr:Putative Isoflavone reductase family protein (AFU_orthologue; AFUA_1G12510) [Aspergillus calidoustus]
MSKSNLLVFGATGAIGTYIIAAIVNAKDSFGRIAVFTSPNTLSTKATEINALRENGVEIITGDVTKKEDVVAAFEGIDTIVSALGRGVIAAQIDLLRWAAETPSIKRFLPSEYGTDIEYSPASATEKPHQQKLKVRAALREVKEGDLEYAYVVTGPYADVPFFLGASKTPRGGAFDVKARKAVLLGDGKGRISLSACADVGKFVVHTLTHWDQAKGRALKLNSFTATPEEILAEFEKQTGEKWEVEYTSLAQLKAFEEEAWARGEPDATGLTLRRIWTEGGTLYDKRDNVDIGAEDTVTLTEAVKEAIRAQLSASL